MGDLIGQATAYEVSGAPDWLRRTHAKGAALLESASLPGRKSERWRNLNLRPLDSEEFLRPPEPLAQIPAELNARFAIDQLDAFRLVFVNGAFCQSLSSAENLPAGATLVRFADACAEQAAAVSRYLGSAVKSDEHLFAALNDRLLADGVFLHLERGVELSRPVHIVWLTTAAPAAFHVPQRLLVVLEANARAAVIEHFVSSEERQNVFTHGVTELCLLQGARLDHYRLHLEEPHALHIGGVHAALQRDADLNSFHLAHGSALKRIDLVVNYLGEGGRAELNGVYLPKARQQVDYHTTVEHRVPNCTTSEVFRGIVSDEAKAIFNGRIHIHPDAQKTLAQLSNKNLLTSDKAEVYTKPELEIYADDVQCAHGATVAQLDENALHYLMTRGVGRAEAQVMLSFGFINELVNKVALAPLADYLRPQLARHFTRDQNLMRHIA